MTDKEAREAARALGLPTTRYATSPKSGKTHRNWIPRRELESMIAEANAGKPVAQIAAEHNATPGRPRPAAVAPAATPAPAPAPANEEKSAPAHAKPAKRKPTPEEIANATKWNKYLSDFHAAANARFLNTAANCETAAAVKNFAVSYFKLSGSAYAADAEEKAKSAEAAALFRETAALSPAKKINNRLAIWYGEPGTGKTTKAIAENPDAAVVICNSEVSPNELFRGFTFVEDTDETGKVIGSHPAFKPCALRNAMEEGKTIILDEINLLSVDCLRALQTVTDGKDKVKLDNEEIEIKPGFRVIGTMNLNIGEEVYPLPAPLIDRADELREFTLTDAERAAFAYC